MAEKRFIIEVRTKGFARATKDFDTLNKNSKNFRTTTNNMRQSTNGLEKEFGRLRNRILVYTFAVGGAVAAMNRFISAASGFQDVQTRLVGLTGGVDQAEKAFAKFNEVAATTPFQLQDVVNAGAQLEAFGVNSEATLSAVTDLAAFMGTTATEAASALGRAFAGGAGAADILRERGILQLIKDSQGIQDLTKITLPEFRRALLSSLVEPSAGIAGSSERLSKTFSGAVSNMQDAITRFAAALGGPLLPRLTQLANTIEVAFRDANAQRILQLSTALGVVAAGLLVVNNRFKILAAMVSVTSGGISKLVKVIGALAGIKLVDFLLQSNNAFSSFNNQVQQNVSTVNQANRATQQYISTLQNQNIVLGLQQADQDRLKAMMMDLTLLTMQNNQVSDERIKITQAIFRAEQNLSKELANKVIFDREAAVAGKLQIETVGGLTEAQIQEVQVIAKLTEAQITAIKQGKQTINTNSDITQSFNIMANAINKMKGGTMEATDVFALMIKVASQLVALSNPVAGSILGVGASLFSGIAHTGGLITNRGVQRFARGGVVQGEDNVPILAQAGEFVMRREAVENIGLRNLMAMNQSGSAGGVTINVAGNMIANDEFVRDTLIPEINRTMRQKLA